MPRLLEHLKTLFCEVIWGWMAIATKISGGNLANPLRQLLAVQLAAQRGGRQLATKIDANAAPP